MPAAPFSSPSLSLSLSLHLSSLTLAIVLLVMTELQTVAHAKEQTTHFLHAQALRREVLMDRHTSAGSRTCKAFIYPYKASLELTKIVAKEVPNVTPEERGHHSTTIKDHITLTWKDLTDDQYKKFPIKAINEYCETRSCSCDKPLITIAYSGFWKIGFENFRKAYEELAKDVADATKLPAKFQMEYTFKDVWKFETLEACQQKSDAAANLKQLSGVTFNAVC